MELTSQDNLTAQKELEVPEVKTTIFSPLEDQELRHFKIGAILLYVLAYFYASSLLQFQTHYFFPIAIGLVLLVEFLANKLALPFLQMENSGGNRLERRLFLATTILQALSLSIWGFHYQLILFQFLALHISFIFYTLSRTGWLSQGRLGIMVWYDSLQGFLSLPSKNFLAGILVFLEKRKTKSDQDIQGWQSKKTKDIGLVSISLLAAGILVYFVWTQLSQVSENFASLTSGLGYQIQYFFANLFTGIYDPLLMPKLFLAIPVSLYIYGLIAGSLLGKKDSILSHQRFHKNIEHLQVFPAYTAYIIIGSLCLTYALFFLTGLTELSDLLSAGPVAAHEASTVAVSGFWQLVRVSMLNFAVLAVFYLIAKKPLWDQKGTRLATTVLFIFATLLALLAGWKLFGIYIFLYGPTPLRLLSAWFVLVLLVWCLLTLIRLYKPIQAIRIGIFYALISFTLLTYLYPLLLFR